MGIELDIMDEIEKGFDLIETLQKDGIKPESTNVLKSIYQLVQLNSERLDNLKLEIKNNKIPILGENLLFFIDKIISLIEDNKASEVMWHIQCELLPCYEIWKYIIGYFYISCRDTEGVNQYWEKERQYLNTVLHSPKLDPEEDYPYEVSIIVLFFNSLEITKECIESIFKYTKDINYELITVNNGSDEETTTWSETLPHTKKIHIKNNIGSSMGTVFAMSAGITEGKYCIYLSNDVVVTKNYAKNLLTCIKSDPSIGMAAPVCNSLINRQTIPVNYKDMKEMQKFAAKYNKSDPLKWEERARILPYAAIYRPTAMENIGFIYDPIFFKCDVYADDDLSQKLKHAGYKLINCADTFIHHSQKASHGGNNNDRQAEGRQAFWNKYGMDVFYLCEDQICYTQVLPDFKKDNVNLLVLDSVNCEDALAVKNSLKQHNINTHLSAFVTDKRKLRENEAIIDEAVFSADIDDISNRFGENSFDIILVSPELGYYSNIVQLLKNLRTVLNHNGIMMLNYSNPITFNFLYSLMLMVPFSDSVDLNCAIKKSAINYELLLTALKDAGFTHIEGFHLKDFFIDKYPQDKDLLINLVPKEFRDKLLKHLAIKKFYIVAGID